MSEYKFIEFRNAFEKMAEKGVVNGVFIKTGVVSIENKLSTGIFGNRMGKVVDSSIIFAMNYYGYVKKSYGLIELIKEKQLLLKSPYQLRILNDILIVNFGSVKIGQILLLAPELAGYFSLFKKELLDVRGFRHNFIF